MPLLRRPGIKSRVAAGLVAGVIGVTTMMPHTAEARTKKPVAAKVEKKPVNIAKLRDKMWQYGDFGGETGIDIRFEDIYRDFKDPVERDVFIRMIIDFQTNNLEEGSWRSDMASLRKNVPDAYKRYFDLKLKEAVQKRLNNRRGKK